MSSSEKCARYPRLPVFTPAIGISVASSLRAVRRNVPSPPKLIATSASGIPENIGGIKSGFYPNRER